MSNHRLMPTVTRILQGCVLPMLAVTLTINSVGCSGLSCCRAALAPYETWRCESFTRIKAKIKARQIWRAKYQHCYGGRGFASDIRQGFIDGFVDTALGGSGCPPLIPPQAYCGQNKAASPCWYEGFPLGAAAAESCGAVNWCKTPLSPALAACLAQTSCSPGCVPCQDVGTSAPKPPLPEYESGLMNLDQEVFQQHVGDDIQAEELAPPGIGPLDSDSSPVPIPEPLELDGATTNGVHAGDWSANYLPAPVDSNLSNLPELGIENNDQTEEQPAVDGPVAMPNLQVDYQVDLLDVFRDVDVTQAMLHQQLPQTSDNRSGDNQTADSQ